MKSLDPRTPRELSEARAYREQHREEALGPLGMAALGMGGAFAAVILWLAIALLFSA